MARILILDEAAERHASLKELLDLRGHEVVAADSFQDGGELLARQEFEVVLAAFELPDGTLLDWMEANGFRNQGPYIIVMAETAHWEKVGRCLDTGASDYLAEPISAGPLNLALSRAEGSLKYRKLSQYGTSHAPADQLPVLTGKSEAAEDLRQTIRQSSHARATVLIQGEYGTGHTEVALALASEKGQPVVRFDCAAVAESNIETALFGGGQEKSNGVLELAQGGTLILENASLLPWGAQAALLDFLKAKEGDARDGHGKLDVRIIATVQEDLWAKVRNGDFREELFYALNILPVALPPLRERKGDIPALAEIFRQRQVRRTGSGVLAISPKSLAALQEYAWPGNLAELRMVIERAVVLCGEGVVEPQHLRLSVSNAPESSAASSLETLAELERRHILHVLQQCDGNRIRTAETLGISIRTLRNKLKEYRTVEVAEGEPEAAVA